MLKLLKYTLSVGLAATIIGFLTINFVRPTIQTLEPFAMSSVCGKQSTRYSAKLRSKVVLNHKVLKRIPNRQDYQDAIADQLGYLRGVYFNHFRPKGMHLAFANHWRSLAVLSESVQSYGADLVIDTPKPYPEVPRKEYIDSARQVGKVNFSDLATIVDYEVEIEAIGCSESEQALALDLAIVLPSDPYLAYWAVPADKRVQRSWRSVSAKVNPCADNEMADLPSPEYYWYFYDPYAEGCAPVIERNAYVNSQLQLTEEGRLSNQVQIDHEKLRALDEIKISLVFGYIVHDEQYAGLNQVALAIQSGASGLGPETSAWDTSSAQFLWLWNKLDTFLDIGSKAVEVADGALIVHAQGRFRGTGQKFTLSFYLGPTDLYGPIPTNHWSHTLSSMLKSDVFIYAGHSGLGENLRINTIVDQAIPLSSLTSAPKYQIFAYLSCYSYTYFDQGIYPALPWLQSREQVDLFLTGGMTYEFGQASFGVLRTINNALIRRDAVDLTEFFPRDTFIVFKSFREKRTNTEFQVARHRQSGRLSQKGPLE